jgi:hypothetical protein
MLLQLCVEWGGSKSSSENVFLCLSRHDEGSGKAIALAVTEEFSPVSAISFSPAFPIDWTFEEDGLYYIQLCDYFDGDKRVLSDCRFNISEAVAARRLRRPLLRQLVATTSQASTSTATIPTATLMLSLQHGSSPRTRTLRIHASCQQLRGTDALLEIRFLGREYEGDVQARIDSEGQWKFCSYITESSPTIDQAECDIPLEISISRPESVRSFDVVPKLKMRSSMRTLSEAAVLNQPILIAAVQGVLELRIHMCAFDFEMSLFDRIASGLEINVSFAIDFSISNGDQDNPSSLHYLWEGGNEYQRIISSLLRHLRPYSNAQRVAMLGFGAQLQDGVVSHCFSLNGRSHHPYCDGAEASLQAYETALANVSFSGPTCIAPVINAVVAMHHEIWSSQHQAQEYHIMFVVFDTPCRDIQVSVVPSIFNVFWANFTLAGHCRCCCVLFFLAHLRHFGECSRFPLQSM